MTAVTDTTAETEAPEPTGGLRFVAVRANLLPDEVVGGRRTDVLRRHVVIGLAGLVAAIVLGFGFSWWQTHSATSDLQAAQANQTALQRQQQSYAPLVADKSKTATIDGQLRALMAGDVTWSSMLSKLRAGAPSGVTVTQVDGTVAAGAAGTAGGSQSTQDVLNQTGRQQIGSLTLTGTAKDKRAVADYADSLSKIKGLGTAFVSNVTTAQGRASWTITVTLTTDALGGRYQVKSSNGGK